jgi:hypothetical protein
VPAMQIDHLLGNDANDRKDRQDFEDLLRQAAARFSPSVKSSSQSPPRETSAVSPADALSA